jgi:hypothetical protein
MPYRPRQWGARRMRRSVTVALVVLALTVAGCSVPGQPAQVTASAGLSVHVLRTSAFPQNHIPPFERTVTDPAQAEALYAAVQALPPFPKTVMYCPDDIGEAYHLTFTRGQTTVSSAVVSCRQLSLSQMAVSRWPSPREMSGGLRGSDTSGPSSRVRWVCHSPPYIKLPSLLAPQRHQWPRTSHSHERVRSFHSLYVPAAPLYAGREGSVACLGRSQ